MEVYQKEKQKPMLKRSGLFVIKDLYTLGVLADIRNKSLLYLVAFAAGDAKDQFVE